MRFISSVPCPFPLAPSLTVVLHAAIGSFFLGFFLFHSKKENCPRSKKKKPDLGSFHILALV
jgi:hypothetical protein